MATRIASIRRRRQDPIHAIARAGLFDLDYYRAQFERPEDAPREVAAALAFHIASGRARGLSFHPFFEGEWWDAAEDPDAAAQEGWFIEGRLQNCSTSPLIAGGDEPIGVSEAFVRDVIDGRRIIPLPGGMTGRQTRAAMVEALAATVSDRPNRGTASGVDWDTVRRDRATRVRDRVSVLVPTYQDWRMTVDAVRAALRGAPGADVEVVVVDNGSRLAVTRLLVAVFLDDPRVRIVRASENTNFAGGMNIAFARSTGEYVLLLNNDAMLTDGWYPLLRAPLDKSADVRGVQPLLLYPDNGRVQAAGTMFLGEGVLPWHFLAGHPVADAERMRSVRFAAVTAAVMMFRADDLIDAEGFDEGYANGYEDVDLCLRLRRNPDDHFRVVTEARAFHPEGSSPGRSTHDSANRRRFLDRWRGGMPGGEAYRYEELGLRLAALRPVAYSVGADITLTDPHLIRPSRSVVDGAGQGLASLRWALVVDAPGADDGVLAETRAILEDLGQEVVGPVRGVHWSDALDDVVLGFGERPDSAPRASAYNVHVGGSAVAGWDLEVPTFDRAAAFAIIQEAVQARRQRFGAR